MPHVKIHCACKEVVKIDSILINPKNVNNHPQIQVDLLAKVIEANGWRSPIVISKRSGFVVKGHGRLLAAKLLGCEEVPIDFQEYETEEMELADMLADNRLAELAEIDTAKLKDLLQELDTGNMDMSLTGYSEMEIERLMMQYHVEGINDPEAEWTGMPVFENQDLQPHKKLWVAFKNKEDYAEFAMLIGQDLTDDTRPIWYPYLEPTKVANLRYAQESEDNSERVVNAGKILKYKLYIPSKGRAKTCLTAEHLHKYGIPFFLVVEPQDKDLYIDNFGKDNVLVMDENDRGISYVRNWIKKYSKEKGEEFHWQLDDNIKSFMRRVDGKNIKESPDLLFTEAEEYLNNYSNIGIASFIYTRFAWTSKTPISVNKQCASCVCVNNQTEFNWRDNIMEDTDYSMQVLSSNLCTINFNTLLIDKVQTSTMSGGNTEITYSGNGRTIRANGLIQAWPDKFQIGDDNGRVTIKPSRVWGTFKQSLITKVES